MKMRTKRHGLSLSIVVLVISGLLNISLTSTIQKQSQKEQVVKLLDGPVPCMQVDDIDQFYDENQCLHSIVRMDCWSGGWDMPCLEGIEYTIECPGEEAEIVGGFSTAQFCKEPD